MARRKKIGVLALVLALLINLGALLFLVNTAENVRPSPGTVGVSLIGFSEGINWDIQSLPVVNAPSTGNNGNGATSFIVNVSVSGGTARVYIRANGNLVDALSGESISLANELYSFSTTDPTVSGAAKHSLDTDDQIVIDEFAGGNIYFKFFLNVDEDQLPGTYGNLIQITAEYAGPLIDPPTNLQVLDSSPEGVSLSWNDNSDNEDGFVIEKSSTSASTGFGIIGAVGANVDSFTDVLVTADSQYWYRVYAYNSEAASDYSNMVVASTSEISLPAEGSHVATLELSAPSAEEFLLHGTIPVPADVFTIFDEGVGSSPFGIELPGGTIVPAQTIGVTRDSTYNYDVVEVAARVNKGGALTGSRIQYKVILMENVQHGTPQAGTTVREAISGASSPINLPAEVRELLNEGSLLVRARDPFNHLYVLDITDQRHGEQKIFKYGSEVVQGRTYSTMTPVSGTPIGPPTGALNHLMGVHSYFTVWKDEGVLQLDLRVSNSASGLHPSGGDNIALKKLYFKDFELLVPIDREVEMLWDYPASESSYTTTYNGNNYRVYPLIAEQPGGALHFLPERGQVNYRLAISKPAYAEQRRELLEHDWLGFSIYGESTTPEPGELWSWHNPLTANYFPSKVGLPTLDYLGINNVRNYLVNEYSSNKNRFETGQPGGLFVSNGHLGWAYPIMGTYGGETGGTEINLVAGHTALMSASREGYLNILLVARGYSDRYRAFVFKGNGEHLRYNDAIVNAPLGEVVPARFFSGFDYNYNCPGSGIPNGKCDVFGYASAPMHQINHVQSSGLTPTYEAGLLAYQNIDEQHVVRATKEARAAVLIGNDALLRDEVEAHGELAHFIMSTKPMGYNFQGIPLYNPSGSIIGTGSDGDGARLGRGKYHPILNLVAYYNILKDDEHREYLREEWFNRYLDIIETSQIECTGVISTMVTKDTDDNFFAIKSNEEGMHSNVLRAIRESVFKNADVERKERLEEVWQKHTDSFIVDINDPSNGYVWSHSFGAPRVDVPVAPADAPTQVACSLAEVPSEGLQYMIPGTAARFEPQFTFAYAKMETGDEIYDFALRSTVGNFGPSLLSDLQLQVSPASKVEGAGNQGIVALWCAQRGICH